MTEGNVYVKSNLEGMNNDELILFIYQELIKILSQAHHHFGTGDIEKRVLAINKGIEVISTLQAILDFRAGEIALQLRSLYAYSIRQLTRANYDKNPELVVQVSRIFKNLHDAWREKIATDRKKMVVENSSNVRHNSTRGENKSVEIYG